MSKVTINPAVYILPITSTGYDITDSSAAILEGIIALKAATNSLQIDSAFTDKYKLLNEGFSSEAVNSDINNLQNNRKTQKLTFIVPVPNGSGATPIALRAAMVAVQSGATYNVYTVDPYTASTGYFSKYAYAKVYVDESGSPDGDIYTITVETQNHGDYFSTELPLTYSAE